MNLPEAVMSVDLSDGQSDQEAGFLLLWEFYFRSRTELRTMQEVALQGIMRRMMVARVRLFVR